MTTPIYSGFYTDLRETLTGALIWSNWLVRSNRIFRRYEMDHY